MRRQLLYRSGFCECMVRCRGHWNVDRQEYADIWDIDRDSKNREILDEKGSLTAAAVGLL